MSEKIKYFFYNLISFPNYILFHPFDGFDDFKTGKKGKMWVAILMMALFALLNIITFQYEGFIINNRNPLDLNNIQIIFTVALILGLFVVGNWSVTTLMSGKGNFKEIFMVTGYSLFPIVIIGFPAVFLSNYLTLEESSFYTLIMGLAYFLTGWMLFMGILNIHEFGLFKTLWCFLCTAVSMMVMVFFGLLFFDLIQQFIGFIAAIIEELGLRR